jgi:hypothetical protein
MFTVKADFIGTFKTGDNIVYNLKILNLLYKNFSYADAIERQLLCKPIIIFIASITEAMLHDFHSRIYGHTTEGLRNIPKEVLNLIRGKKYDQFETCIASANKYKLFGDDSRFYEDLDSLRKLRNRIHIQNVKQIFHKDESEVYTQEQRIMAEVVAEKTVKQLYAKYSRPAATTGYVRDFEFPWKEHLQALEQDL